MKVSKIFKIEDAELFNSFVIDHPPVGENGLKLQTNYIYLQYDDGKILGTEDKIKHLKSELNVLLINELEEYRQYRDAVLTLKSFDYFKNQKAWKEISDGIIPMSKQYELTGIKIDVIVNMLKELGVEINVMSHNPLPNAPEEPVSAPKAPKNK